MEPTDIEAAKPSPSDRSRLAPDAERLVSDVETLKALSDPIRLRILEAMVSRSDAAWSVKEIAARLGVPQTRLYHHIELLLDRDLVRAAEQRVVSGIIETRYRVAALGFRLDHRLLSSDPSLQAAGRELLHSVFDGARDDVARALHVFLEAHASDDTPEKPGVHPDRPVLQRGFALLTPRRSAEFRERLAALHKEFESDPTAPGAEPWGFLVALYRLPVSSTTETSDD